jgi:hypothetical protein
VRRLRPTDFTLAKRKFGGLFRAIRQKRDERFRLRLACERAVLKAELRRKYPRPRGELAEILGVADGTRLAARWPKLLRQIAEKRRKLQARERERVLFACRRALRAALTEIPAPSVVDVVGRIQGCSTGFLYGHFASECAQLVSRRKQYAKDRWAQVEKEFRALIASGSVSSLKAAAARLGCAKSILRHRFPSLCHAVAKRYAQELAMCAKRRRVPQV